MAAVCISLVDVTVLMSNKPVITINPLDTFQLFRLTHMLSHTMYSSACHCCHTYPLIQIILPCKSHIITLTERTPLAGAVPLPAQAEDYFS